MSITKKILSFAGKALSLLVKIVVFPITYAYRRIKKRRARSRRASKDFPGVYVVSNNEQTVKIGRSKHVYQRLRSYRGYQADGRDIPVLLLLRCRDHKRLEKQLHAYASRQGLERSGRTEVFQCKNKAQFIRNLQQYALSELDHSVHVVRVSGCQ